MGRTGLDTRSRGRSHSFRDWDVERVQQAAYGLVRADQMEHVADPADSEQFCGLVVE
jgi:hypothetical protein